MKHCILREFSLEFLPLRMHRGKKRPLGNDLWHTTAFGSAIHTLAFAAGFLNARGEREHERAIVTETVRSKLSRRESPAGEIHL